MRLSAIILVLLSLLFAPIKAKVIPVFDMTELQKRIEIRLMEDAFRIVEKLIREQELVKEIERYEKFKNVYEGIKYKLLDMFSNNDLIEMLEMGDLFLGEYSKGAWRDIWRKLKDIRTFYPELNKGYEDILTSQFYQKDDWFRRYSNRFIEISKEREKDFDNHLEHLQNIREIGQRRIEKIKLRVTELKKFANNGRVGKTMAGIGYLNMERLRLLNEKNTGELSSSEQTIKENLREAVLREMVDSK